MIYKGTFKDINDTEYTVRITTNGDSSSTTNVVLGTTPITTEIETSDAHIYKPCKYSSATIKVISSDYMFDVYSSTAQQNKVELIDNNGAIRWIGYTTPNLYSMGYESEFEELEIEAIDGLSTLQYYKYTPISGTKSIVKIIDIIDHILSKCNCYTRYYISDNTKFSETATGCLMQKVEISEQNFWDEDDEAMTMQVVLEEICKYFNLTCVADGVNVYFLDYDAIKSGNNSYHRLNIGNTTSATLVEMEQSKAITGANYASNGGQISLDNVYNKVTVKDSLYSFDSVIPSIWNEEDLYLYLTQDINNGNPHYYEEVNEDGIGGKHKCFFKYYSNMNYKSYYYDKNLNPVTMPFSVTYGSTQTYIGATICKAYFKKVDSFDDAISELNFTNYVLLHTHNLTNTTSLKLFELEVNNTKPSFIGGKNTYLVIKGNFLMMDREGEMYIMQGYSNKDDNFNKDQLYIDCSLMYGNKWWNGEGWQSIECKFRLPFDNNGQTDHCINQNFPVKNTITWEMGLDESGYAIPLPTDEVLTGKPKFILYSPKKFDGSYRCDAVWLSDFDIVAKVATFETDKENDSDTEYTNIIDTDYVNELDDQEFKICTWDNKEANYSAVVYNNGSSYQYLDKVYNKASKQYLRPEEHLIYRLVNQYSAPSIILNLNLNNDINLYSTITDKWLPNRTFIVDSITIDWENRLSNIKLIEKK